MGVNGPMMRRAIALHEEALSIRRQFGDRLGTCMSLNNLSAVLCLQSDFDRILFELLRGDAEAPHVRANVQRLLLVDVEVHVNRSGLDDGGELGGGIGPHQLAQRHQVGVGQIGERTRA